MSPYVALRKLWWHRRLTGRDYLALLLLLITVTAFASVYFEYRNSAAALREANRSILIQRTQRKLTEYRFCKTINRTIAINNRDRKTLVEALHASIRDVRLVRRRSPLLARLIQLGIPGERADIAARPLLAKLNCVKVIQHPVGPLPPGIRTVTQPTLPGG